MDGNGPVDVEARNPVLLREKDEQDVKKQLTQSNIKIVFFILLV
jgi:hypothetical protein